MKLFFAEWGDGVARVGGSNLPTSNKCHPDPEHREGEGPAVPAMLQNTTGAPMKGHGYSRAITELNQSSFSR